MLRALLRSGALVCALLGTLPALAQTTPISGLPTATAPIGTELVPLVQGGATKQVAISGLAPGLPVFSSSVKGLVPSGGTGTTYLKGDGTWGTPASGGGGGTTLHAGYTSGRVYRSGPYATASGVIPAYNTVFAQPILVPNAVTVTDLGIRVLTGQSGSSGNICLYPSVNNLPSGNLIAGTTVTPTTSAANATGSVTSAALPAGIVWGIQIYNQTATMPTTLAISTAEPQMSWQLGTVATGTWGGNLTGLAGTVQGTAYTGTCPATAPTGLSDYAGAIPLISLKVQ